MSKHSNSEYTRKPLSSVTRNLSILGLVVGLILVGIGVSVGEFYTGPENNHEKTEKEKLEVVRLKKEVLTNKLLLNKPKPADHSAVEKAHDKTSTEHDSHGADAAHAGEHGHESKSKNTYTIENRVWANFLVMFLFVLSIGAGSLFLVGLEHLVGAKWSTPLRRIAEIFCFMLIPAFAFGLIIYLGGMNALYDAWVNNPTGDDIIKGKKGFLNPTAFFCRFLIVFAFWGFFYWFFNRNSKAQDTTRDQKYTRASAKLAPVFIIFNAFAITMIAIDFIMTLSPKWFSTMFGVAYFGGSVMAAIAANLFASVRLKENNYLHPQMKNDTFYSLAGLLFGFNCFWAYVSFCQFMLIWYSNIPEETFWFLLRWDGQWLWYTLFMIVFHFVIPLALLISRSAKTNLGRLKVMSVWLLVAHYVDLYWQVVPTFSDSPFVGLVEVGFLIISLSVLAMFFWIKARNVNHVPVGDPKLEIGLGFRLH